MYKKCRLNKNKALHYCFSLGNTLGTIISLFMSGYLCEYVGWESLFYVYGKISF